MVDTASLMQTGNDVAFVRERWFGDSGSSRRRWWRPGGMGGGGWRWGGAGQFIEVRKTVTNR